jgi:D-beta-D-heptose 7-phosphate kinase/D-beta-D-heptose 1-phosphate adenosyltransferase
MLDVYLRGEVERISPEAPVPVVRVRERRDALGGAANVAQNVAALGAACALVATVGRDAAGERLTAMLAAIGADPAALVAWTARRRPRPASSPVPSRWCGSTRRTTRTSTTPAADRVLEAVRTALAAATRWCSRTTTRACCARR